MRINLKNSGLLLVAAITLAACAANPWAYATTPLDKAHVTLRSLEIVQTEVLGLVQSPDTPVSVTPILKDASRQATAAATQLGGAITEVEQARAELIAANGTSARLEVANARLVQWTNTVLARIKAIEAAIAEAKKHHGT